MPSTQGMQAQKALEDPLGYLPKSGIEEFKKGTLIYNQDQPNDRLYLVNSGLVKVFIDDKNDGWVVVRFCAAEEFFGEGAILQFKRRGEQAVALQKTTVMSWPITEIEQQMDNQPRLGLALWQLAEQRNRKQMERIRELAAENIYRRLGWTLVGFSDPLGTAQEGEAREIPPFTHDNIAQYIGTSREICTCYMNAYRRLGFLRYSRKQMTVYPKSLRGWLEQGNGKRVS